MAVGKNIREARNAKKMGLRELCRQVKLSPVYLSNVENGHDRISYGALQRIAAALETDFDKLAAGGPVAIPKDLLAWINGTPGMVQLIDAFRKSGLTANELRTCWAEHLNKKDDPVAT